MLTTALKALNWCELRSQSRADTQPQLSVWPRLRMVGDSPRSMPSNGSRCGTYRNQLILRYSGVFNFFQPRSSRLVRAEITWWPRMEDLRNSYLWATLPLE